MFPDSNWPMPDQVDPDKPGHETLEEIGRQLDSQFARALERRQRGFERQRTWQRTAQVMNSVGFFSLAVIGAALLILLLFVAGWYGYRYLPAEAKSLYHLLNPN